jgi:hypothetical protein
MEIGRCLKWFWVVPTIINRVLEMTDSPLTIRNCVFSFKCNAQWEDLEEISSNDYVDPDQVRFCSTCQREVFLSETDEEIAQDADATGVNTKSTFKVLAKDNSSLLYATVMTR